MAGAAMGGAERAKACLVCATPADPEDLAHLWRQRSLDDVVYGEEVGATRRRHRLRAAAGPSSAAAPPPISQAASVSRSLLAAHRGPLFLGPSHRRSFSLKASRRVARAAPEAPGTFLLPAPRQGLPALLVLFAFA